MLDRIYTADEIYTVSIHSSDTSISVNAISWYSGISHDTLTVESIAISMIGTTVSKNMNEPIYINIEGTVLCIEKTSICPQHSIVK